MVENRDVNKTIIICMKHAKTLALSCFCRTASSNFSSAAGPRSAHNWATASKACAWAAQSNSTFLTSF